MNPIQAALLQSYQRAEKELLFETLKLYYENRLKKLKRNLERAKRKGRRGRSENLKREIEKTNALLLAHLLTHS